MDKYNKKTSFQKWFSAINFNGLSKEAKTTIETFDYYSKKLDFETTIKVLLYAVYEELPSYREIGRSFISDYVKKLGSIRCIIARCPVGQQI